MLSTGVLCMKKRKKRSYCIVAENTNNVPTATEKTKRTAGGVPAMLQITEDTPPDMLAGAMDLTVHLPSGRSVKMSVERSTPMMDLLVQITTNYHLQLSGYTLQALGMAPSFAHSDTILPYKPNTPIGALDTQHVRVIPKSKTLSVPKNVPPGQLPFESTFRLKVHLPRNQLFVTRVTQNVRLDDIMKKVCDEKNLDCHKYEFRHPGNLDEILDPSLTLNDYAITEIHLVQKGSGMTQAFSTGDIMTLRKEDDKKQMHNRPASGVFNLIFRRGKSSTGSLSSDNRSISPTHSEDSRSVTPPGVPQQIMAPPQPESSTGRPKPPQRKRRPAPKPPQDPSSSNDLTSNKTDQSLTICHSRNSSDSSGYHEASILSENASLPRRPKSTMIGEDMQKTLLGLHSQSTSNLSKMSPHSKSTSSLTAPSRKKKSAPPPPPVSKHEISESNEEASPLVASQTESHGIAQQVVVRSTGPVPIPRTRVKLKTAPSPSPRQFLAPLTTNPEPGDGAVEILDVKRSTDNALKENSVGFEVEKTCKTFEALDPVDHKLDIKQNADKQQPSTDKTHLRKDAVEHQAVKPETKKPFDAPKAVTKVKPPEVVALHPKASDSYSKSLFNSRKRAFLVGSSLLDTNNNTGTVKSSRSDAVDDIDDQIDVEMFNSCADNSRSNSETLNQLHGMHEFGVLKKKYSDDGLGVAEATMTKWNTQENLVEVSRGRDAWVGGDNSDAESTASMPPIVSRPTHVDSFDSVQSLPPSVLDQKVEDKEGVKTEAEHESDWQYQLPSPPKAFRDTSPVSFTYHQSATDSVVTSPELFEKLKTLNKADKDTTSSVMSEDEKPILNKLSLENLEKRKSLVYNRELATSLKQPSETSSKERGTESFANSLTKFERVYDEVKKSSPKQVTSSTSTLPNFKITTYNPKQKLDIFEDDTVRSGHNRNLYAEPSRPDNNIFIRKTGVESSTNDHVYKFYRAKESATKSQFPVLRSESFTRNQTWMPSKPVTRSKSHVALNKYEDKTRTNRAEDTNLTKSNSLFDVSGLQSLEVMRSIQNKLKTPVESREELSSEHKQSEVQNPARTHRLPSINMGTWSDRPKIPVNVKEDPDYKFSVKTQNASEMVVNTLNTRNNFEVRNKIVTTNHNNGVSVRVDHENSSKMKDSDTTQKSEKVVIKIGSGDRPVFRRPLGSVNSQVQQRPHSFAFGNDFDISRVPIVRAVELKKPYKDINTSSTQIPQNGYNKSTFRINSYLQTHTTPVVKGFRSGNDVNLIKGWNQQLHRAGDGNKTVVEPPKAPVLPKFEAAKPRDNCGQDPKEQLLQAIRDFGGKKGLRAVKA